MEEDDDEEEEDDEDEVKKCPFHMIHGNLRLPQLLDSNCISCKAFSVMISSEKSTPCHECGECIGYFGCLNCKKCPDCIISNCYRSLLCKVCLNGGPCIHVEMFSDNLPNEILFKIMEFINC